MPYNPRNYSGEEIIRRGKEIYARDIRSKVEPEHVGEYIVIDVESGDYEFGPNELEIAHRLINRRPDGPRFMNKIGYTTLGKIGGRMHRTSE